MAQSRGDPARLDDFAVAAQLDDPSHIDQLAPGGGPVTGSPAPRERAVVAAQESAPPSAALVQISTHGQAPEQAQLSRPGSRPDESRAAVSTTADSRPQGVTRLQGQDRCDPQLAKEDLVRCQRILELRAQEFHAPAPPKLSAEQQLLAEQRAGERQERGSLQHSLRLASGDEPDADLKSNQELASIYLDRQRPTTDTPAPDASQQPDTATDAKLAQILEALQLPAGGSVSGQ
jgi:hypothetical protein